MYLYPTGPVESSANFPRDRQSFGGFESRQSTGLDRRNRHHSLGQFRFLKTMNKEDTHSSCYHQPSDGYPEALSPGAEKGSSSLIHSVHVLKHVTSSFSRRDELLDEDEEDASRRNAALCCLGWL